MVPYPVTSGVWSQWVPLEPEHEERCAGEHGGRSWAQSLADRHHLRKGCQQTCLWLGSAPYIPTASWGELCHSLPAPTPAGSHYCGPGSHGAASSPNV